MPEILGLGTPILDYLIEVDDDYVNSLAGIHGSSNLINYATLKKILHSLSSPKRTVTGGCTSNAIKGLTRLGHHCAFFGKIGDDLPGETFSESLKSYGVHPHLKKIELPTAQVACLITPDHERTMYTYLGAGAKMDQSDLKKEFFEGIKLMHIEGYLLNRDAVVETAMEYAKQAGALISFDLSSFEIVREYKNQIKDLLHKYVDIAFANEEEAFALTNLSPEKACILLKDYCEVAIVKAGSQGCWGATVKEKIHCPAFPVNVLDTTGAGDLFASGFLHGYLKRKPLIECLRYGAYLASKVIQVFGAEIPEDQWPHVLRHVWSKE